MSSEMDSNQRTQSGNYRKDYEKGVENSMTEFDPFKERKNEYPMTDTETLTHLMRASLGTGILAMPIAFKFSGLALGVFATILTALICTHCSCVLIKCAHELYKRTKRTRMSFAEVAEAAFANGPKWGRRYAKFSRIFIQQCIFWTYFGSCAVYAVIIATNFQQIAEHYLGYPVNLRLCIALLLIPLTLLSYITSLKYLAPVSMVANVLMTVGIGITINYFFTDLPPIEQRPLVGNLYALPDFFSITIFAMEAIGVIMPLENQMKTPQNFSGIFGVLNKGMAFVTFVYISVGFLGFWRFGDATAGSITLNLPTEEKSAQAVKLLIALAVTCTFSLQYYVCVEIATDAIKDKFVQHLRLVNYAVRIVLVIAAVVLAVAVPTIASFISLVGAFCFSVLGLLVPVVIEFITYWDTGYGPFNWIIYKNVIILIFGLFALVFGTKDAIKEIIGMYAANDS